MKDRKNKTKPRKNKTRKHKLRKARKTLKGGLNAKQLAALGLVASASALGNPNKITNSITLRHPTLNMDSIQPSIQFGELPQLPPRKLEYKFPNDTGSGNGTPPPIHPRFITSFDYSDSNNKGDDYKKMVEELNPHGKTSLEKKQKDLEHKELEKQFKELEKIINEKYY